MILGLGGFATSGKDAVADTLVEEHGWAKTYMSKPLERALLTLNPIVVTGYDDRLLTDMPWTYRELHEEVGYDESKKWPEVRRLLQVLGTEVGRDQFDSELWVRLAFEEVDRLHTAGQDVVLTGLRFPNELWALHSRRGIAVWVDRPGIGAVNAHVSDNTLRIRDFDRILSNDGTLEDLPLNVRQFLGRD